MKVIYEDFHSIDSLLNSLQSRKNNRFMSSNHSSTTNTKDFSGTENWDEAIKMLASGYLEIIPKIKKDVKIQSKINSKYTAAVEHPIPKVNIKGFCPCVPNAIRGIPQSMISTDRKPMKRKTLHILYSVGGNCDKPTEWFVNAGTALLSAIDIIEKGGVQTKIDLNFFPSTETDELTFPTVRIKNYGERYSIQKISFPLVHPSMFRRIGFKWLETSPDIGRKYFAYGRAPSYSEIENAIKLKDPATYLISAAWINSHNCSVEEILKKFEVI